jgi:uncharacterized damage-inducible protein DinB
VAGVTTDRTDPPLAADEATTLRGFLDYHRDTLRWKAEGLDHDRLNQALAPSTLTLAGLLKHLALVESHWLSHVLFDRELMPPFDTADWDADGDWEFTSAPDDEPDQLRGLFDEATKRSDALIDEALEKDGLDTLSALPGRRTGGHFSLRWILVHLVEEYARHNGHADLIRESIDGATGE